MKKRALASKVEDRAFGTNYPAIRCIHQSAATNFLPHSAPIDRQRTVTYAFGERQRGEPRSAPRLFIRGGIGGSLKMDLLGIDFKFSVAAFAQWISDGSLKQIHVHRGDIALIDPVQSLRDEQVVLIGLNGFEVFRRLKKKGFVWLLESLDGADLPPIPLLNYPIYGVVFGFVRLDADAEAGAITSALPIASPVRTRQHPPGGTANGPVDQALIRPGTKSSPRGANDPLRLSQEKKTHLPYHLA